MSGPASAESGVPRLQAGRTALLVIDFQQRLMPAIDSGAQVAETARRLIACGRILHLPVLVTEQNPQKLGPTIGPVLEVLPPDLVRYPKMRFSALIDPVQEELKRLKRPDVLLCGVETHVCVLQTALDLLDAGFQPWIVADATGSRRPQDRELALNRLFGAGVQGVSFEMAVMEMLQDAGSADFKAILGHLK